MGVRVCEGNTGIVAGWTNIRLFSKLTANVWKYLEVSWVGLPWGGYWKGRPFVFGEGLTEGPSLLGSARRSV